MRDTKNPAARFVRTFSRLTVLLVAAIFPVVSPTQSPSSAAASSATLNEQQTAGKRLFMQNCSFCHLPKKTNPKSTGEGKTLGPLLKGLFQGERALSEQTVRTFIQRGVPGKMPGFQHGLEAREIDDIIAYLKTVL